MATLALKLALSSSSISINSRWSSVAVAEVVAEVVAAAGGDEDGDAGTQAGTQ